VTTRIAEEVRTALAAGRPVVALESTLLAHGLPPGRNQQVAQRLERTVRDHGAVPATIAVLDGHPTIGLSPAELARVCDPDAGLVKLSRRDLAPAAALGGVHRGARDTWDVSADLGVLATTPILVVCSGVKSVLDIGATLELLETGSVPVLGYRTDRFPAFYLRESDFDVPWRVDTPAEAAAVFAAHVGGVVLANPIPVEHELDRALHDQLLADALLAARDVRGKDVTPVLLEHFHTASAGASLDANEELVVANTALAADVATALSTV
jgi:pseudouridine-5'-phosphate glycosidase